MSYCEFSCPCGFWAKGDSTSVSAEAVAHSQECDLQ